MMGIQGLLGGAVVVAALLATTTPASAQVCDQTGTPCKLSEGLTEANVIAPVVAPNGQRVVFGHFRPNAPDEVYTAPITGGGPPVKLSVAGGSARVVAISPDSTRVLYTLSTSSGTALFSVPIAGPASAGVRLADDIGTRAPPLVRVSPDSLKVVFALPGGNGLRVVPIAGPASAGGLLTDPFVAGGQVGEIRISANSRNVVYRADQDTDGVVELYRVPLTLTPPPDPSTAKLNGRLAANRGVAAFALAPNNGPVVYLADQDDPVVGTELYSVRLGGGGRVKINRTLPSGWRVQSPVDTLDDDGSVPARITPDGSRVVYEIGTVVNQRVFHEFYSVPIAGPGDASARLDHPPLVPPGEIAAVSYKISADSQRVVYTMVDQRIGEPNLPTVSLVSVPAAGPASAGQMLTAPLTSDFVYTLSPDSRRVAFLIPAGTQTNLFSVPIAGGTNVRLNGAERVEGSLRINATSNRIVYRATIGSEGALFSAPLDGNGTRRNLTESLDDVGFIGSVTLTADGLRVVYTMDRGTGQPAELFSSRIAPP